jgi:hypothetical protein
MASLSQQNPLQSQFSSITSTAGNLQRSYLFNLTFSLLHKELNTKYALELNDLTLRATKFIDEKTIVFDEFDDMAVVKFFDLWKGGFPCKITLTLYDNVLKNKTYEKDYNCWLKMRPLTLDQSSNEALKIYADLV